MEQEIFTIDKSTWYSETDGIRIWNQTLVSQFWNQIKIQKFDKEDYTFENYIFPSFLTNNFLVPHKNYFDNVTNNKSINKPFKFINCHFQGGVHFSGIFQSQQIIHKHIFLDNLEFSKCLFDKEFRIMAQNIDKNLIITDCNFLDEVIIFFSTIKEKTSIGNCHFYKKFLYHCNTNINHINFTINEFGKEFDLSKNRFIENFNINEAEFNGKVNVHSNFYNKNGTITYVKINHQSIFKHEHYKNFSFQDIEFSSKNHLFEEVEFQKEGVLLFNNQTFSNVTIRNIDCSKVKFLNSDISQIKFSSCNWNSKKRIVLINEKDFDKNNLIDLQNLEDLYRQLKRIFDSEKNWEMAGKAYVSEMNFRRLRLRKEKSYFSLFIYWFYDFFGGYTQNYIKPMLWFFVTTFIIFPTYYLFENSFQNIGNAFQKSIAASIPWLGTDLKYENWGILAFQKTLCTILITFIVLALRKRFKE